MTVESTPLQSLKISNLVISFSDFDFKGINQNLYNLMVISIVTGNCITQKEFVDQRSSANILYASTLWKMKIPECSLSLYNGDLVDFFREWVNVLGVIELRINFRIEQNIKTTNARYLVIDS